MVVFQVQMVNLVLNNVDSKCQAPVGGDAQAPRAFAGPGEGVGFPGGKGSQLHRTLHIIQVSQHVAEFVDRTRWYPLTNVVRIEPPQTFVNEAPYFHLRNVACNLTLVNRLRGRSGDGIWSRGGVVDRKLKLPAAQARSVWSRGDPFPTLKGSNSEGGHRMAQALVGLLVRITFSAKDRIKISDGRSIERVRENPLIIEAAFQPSLFNSSIPRFVNRSNSSESSIPNGPTTQ
jgi:hypothetical protein